MQSAPPSRHGAAGPPRAQDFPAAGDATWRIYQQIPDMVNGDATAFSFIFVSAGLAEEYHWVVDAALAAMPLATTTDSLRLRTCVEAAFHRVKLMANDMAAEKATATSLLLAAGRMSIRRAWGIADADTVATQQMVLAPNQHVDVDGDIAADVADWATMVEWKDHVVACTTAYDTWKDTHIAYAQQIAIGMPPCNGVIIVRTLVHHYCDPHKQVCDAVVEQCTISDYIPPGVITMLEYKDLVCHKTCHVIDSPRLVWMSRSEEVRDRLVACGLGSAAVRIPAEFDAERSAGSLVALVRRAAGASEQSNVAIDQKSVNAMYAAVTKAISDDATQKGMRKAEGMVVEYRAENGYALGWMGGYMSGMFIYMEASERARSVLTGYAVTRLQEDYPEAWAAGQEHFDLGRKWRKERTKIGILAGYGFLGAATPTDFEAPDDARGAKPKPKASK